MVFVFGRILIVGYLTLVKENVEYVLIVTILIIKEFVLLLMLCVELMMIVEDALVVIKVIYLQEMGDV